LTICGGLFLIFLFWSSGSEDKRREERQGELARLVHLESVRYWAESRRFWERADKRWADHERLMRMILERRDGGREEGQA